MSNFLRFFTKWWRFGKEHILR